MKRLCGLLTLGLVLVAAAGCAQEDDPSEPSHEWCSLSDCSTCQDWFDDYRACCVEVEESYNAGTTDFDWPLYQARCMDSDPQSCEYNLENWDCVGEMIGDDYPENADCKAAEEWLQFPTDDCEAVLVFVGTGY